MIPVLVIDAPDPDPREALLGACSEIVAPERCVAAEPEAAPVATVAWHSQDTARVRVRLGHVAAERELTFLPEDLPSARHGTLGLVIGALVLELGGTRQQATGPSADSATSPPGASGLLLAPSPGPAASDSKLAATPALPAGRVVSDREDPSRERTSWSFGSGATLGPGLTEGPWRIGGFFRVRAMLSQRLGFGASVLASHRAEHRDLTGEWFAVSAGPRFEPTLNPRVDGFVHAELAAERWTMRLVASADEDDERAHRVYAAVRLGAGLGVRLQPWLRFTIGAELATSPGQEVRIAGVLAGTNPRIAPGCLAGLEVGEF